MKNADMPAMPQTITDSNDGAGLVGSHMEVEWQGLTKREMFAMHAPKRPEWFFDFAVENGLINENTCYSNGCFGSLKPEIEMKLLVLWQKTYADEILAELEKQND